MGFINFFTIFCIYQIYIFMSNYSQSSDPKIEYMWIGLSIRGCCAGVVVCFYLCEVSQA